MPDRFHEYLVFRRGWTLRQKIVVKANAPGIATAAELMFLEMEAASARDERRDRFVSNPSNAAETYPPVSRSAGRVPQSGGIVTKNYLVTRDIDLLSNWRGTTRRLSFISVTTLDPDLAAHHGTTDFATGGPPSGGCRTYCRRHPGRAYFCRAGHSGLTEQEVAIHRQAAADGRRKVCGHGAGFDARFGVGPLF